MKARMIRGAYLRGQALSSRLDTVRAAYYCRVEFEAHLSCIIASIQLRELEKTKMMSFRENTGNVLAALCENHVVLVVPSAEATEEHRYAAGMVVLDMLADRRRLLPSYWSSDGDESPDTIKTLDGFAVMTKMLFFSVHFLPGLDPVVAMFGTGPQVAIESARKNHCWCNAFRVWNPDREMAVGVGNWLYSLHKWALLSASEDGGAVPCIEFASINAS